MRTRARISAIRGGTVREPMRRNTSKEKQQLAATPCPKCSACRRHIRHDVRQIQRRRQERSVRDAPAGRRRNEARRNAPSRLRPASPASGRARTRRSFLSWLKPRPTRHLDARKLRFIRTAQSLRIERAASYASHNPMPIDNALPVRTLTPEYIWSAQDNWRRQEKTRPFPALAPGFSREISAGESFRLLDTLSRVIFRVSH